MVKLRGLKKVTESGLPPSMLHNANISLAVFNGDLILCNEFTGPYILRNGQGRWEKIQVCQSIVNDVNE